MERGMRIEDTIERSVVGIAEKHGWESRKLGWIGRKGAPDRIFMRKGRAVFIEFKDPEGELAEIQAREIKRMRSAGLEVWIVDNIRGGLTILGVPH